MDKAPSDTFRARPHTMGFATANDENPLSDGATHLCSSVEADRTGRRWEDGIDPEVELAAPNSIPEEEQDAVVRATEKWLVQELGLSMNSSASECWTLVRFLLMR